MSPWRGVPLFGAVSGQNGGVGPSLRYPFFEPSEYVSSSLLFLVECCGHSRPHLLLTPRLKEGYY